MFVLQIILACYIAVGLLTAGIIAIAVYRLGGIEGFKNTANTLAGYDTFDNSTLYKYFVLIVLFWPLIPFAVSVTKRALDKGL